MYDIPFISMMTSWSIGDDIDVDAKLTWRWCNGEQRRNNDAPIDDPDVISVDKKVADPKVLTSWRQDQHLIDTDKLNSVTDL